MGKAWHGQSMGEETQEKEIFSQKESQNSEKMIEWCGMSKYHNIISEFQGIKFHSKRELKRYQELLILEKCKEIYDIELQPPFPVFINGKKVCTYFADFGYRDTQSKERIIEDCKGYKTDIYRLKKKLVEALYGITILET